MEERESAFDQISWDSGKTEFFSISPGQNMLLPNHAEPPAHPQVWSPWKTSLTCVLSSVDLPAFTASLMPGFDGGGSLQPSDRPSRISAQVIPLS